MQNEIHKWSANDKNHRIKEKHITRELDFQTKGKQKNLSHLHVLS